MAAMRSPYEPAQPAPFLVSSGVAGRAMGRAWGQRNPRVRTARGRPHFQVLSRGAVERGERGRAGCVKLTPIGRLAPRFRRGRRTGGQYDARSAPALFPRGCCTSLVQQIAADPPFELPVHGTQRLLPRCSLSGRRHMNRDRPGVCHRRKGCVILGRGWPRWLGAAAASGEIETRTKRPEPLSSKVLNQRKSDQTMTARARLVSGDFITLPRIGRVYSSHALGPTNLQRTKARLAEPWSVQSI
jgi:hypothetical protein